ncbi:MAG: hypothetical protein ABIZ81_07220 [Opitutaceae bacterium]
MPRASANSARETFVPLSLLAGDVVTFASLVLGGRVRYASPLDRFRIDVPGTKFARSLLLLLAGVALLIAGLVQLGLYETRSLLRREQGLNVVFKGSSLWLEAYFAVSRGLIFDPPISRLFVLEAFIRVVGGHHDL